MFEVLEQLVLLLLWIWLSNACLWSQAELRELNLQGVEIEEADTVVVQLRAFFQS